MAESVFEVFYDGECPLCSREISGLRRLDRKQRILFTDIAGPSGAARAQLFGLANAELMARVHGRTAAGQIVEGVEVFRQLYGALGFQKLVGLTRLPGVRSVLDAAYTVFAKNRLRLTGRCSAGHSFELNRSALMCSEPASAPNSAYAIRTRLEALERIVTRFVIHVRG
jgi:predicted DCC family thiol-disulfide oxidoreductase YuxK